MKYPYKIEHSPLLGCTMEIRFSSEKNRNEILGISFKALGDVLPILDESDIPKQLREEHEKFRFAGDYILKNNEYCVYLSNNVFRIETLREYTLWGNFSKFTNEVLDKILETGIVSKLERISLRYINVFENTPIDSVVERLPQLTIGSREVNHRLKVFRTIIDKGNISVGLVIADNASVAHNDTQKTGALIDINAHIEQENIDIDTLKPILNSLHQIDQEIFFNLVSDTYLKTLKPLYT